MAAVNFTLCPPADGSGGNVWKQCLSAKQLPVSATFHADGEVESTGLSFNDYNFMQTSQHKLSGERRLETPAWILSSASLRKVLIEYLLNRAISQKARVRLSSLSERDQLSHAMKALRAKESHLIARYELLESDYRTHFSCTAPFCMKRRKVLRQRMSACDSQIVLNRNPDRFFQVLYCYFFRRMDSTGTAAECNLRPPAVRQILRRMNRTAERLCFAAPEVRVYRMKKKVVIADGMCTRCGKNTRAENRRRCTVCLAVNRKRRIENDVQSVLSTQESG